MIAAGFQMGIYKGFQGFDGLKVWGIPDATRVDFK